MMTWTNSTVWRDVLLVVVGCESCDFHVFVSVKVAVLKMLSFFLSPLSTTSDPDPRLLEALNNFFMGSVVVGR